MLVSSRLRDERGTIAVIAAVTLPVFLLLAALVMDVGNWYTHGRQLQNRPDAAALAAGVAYGKNWRSCVGGGVTAEELNLANEIADTARAYAGDPDTADYSTGSLPSTLHNTQVASQSPGKLDVVINSTSYDNASDDSDGGNPCFAHAGDDISPGGGQWTDVKVQEHDLSSFVPNLLKWFGVETVLSRNGARARVEIHPILSGRKFLPSRSLTRSSRRSRFATSTNAVTRVTRTP